MRSPLQKSLSEHVGWVVLLTAIVGSTVAFANNSAQPTPTPPGHLRPRAVDISLSQNGVFSGKVVDAQARPVEKAEILFRQSGKQVAKVSTSRNGDFDVTGLTPGVYQIVVLPDRTLTVRVWNKRSAPPVARPELLIVIGDDTIRGQRRIGELLPLENTVVVGGMVAAAIAIPIAIANSSDDTEPVSP